MRVRGLLAGLGLSAILVGCATSYEYSRSKGADKAQVDNDIVECKAVAEKRTGYSEALGAINTCMEGKGYTVTKKGFEIW